MNIEESFPLRKIVEEKCPYHKGGLYAKYYCKVCGLTLVGGCDVWLKEYHETVKKHFEEHPFEMSVWGGQNDDEDRRTVSNKVSCRR